MSKASVMDNDVTAEEAASWQNQQAADQQYQENIEREIDIVKNGGNPSEVDLKNNMIRLPAEKSKSKKPRSLPIIGALAEIIQRRLDCPFVFHRNGKQIVSFRRRFEKAAAAAGMPDLLPHDIGRSAVRNFRRAGLSEHEGMKLSGHETDSIYRRYDIISDDDLTESMNRVQEHITKEPENHKVVPLKREKA